MITLNRKGFDFEEDDKNGKAVGTIFLLIIHLAVMSR